jgi:hypothetical protein
MRVWRQAGHPLAAIAHGILLGVLAVALGHGPAWAQTFIYNFGNLGYSFPAAHAFGQLVNNGTGSLSWSNTVPVGLVLWSKNGSCPTGWAEYTSGRGRMLVALVAGGTGGAAVGTALSNSEDRTTGQHTHPASTSVLLTYGGHVHAVTDSGHVHGGINNAGTAVDADSGDRVFGSQSAGNLTNFKPTGITIGAAATGISVTGTLTVGNSSGVGGTNAPYIQLMACSKQ